MALNGIAGKIALVTGAARRRSIGRATALRLAAEGADVACLDIGRPYDDFPAYGVAAADELDEVVREIRALGRRSLALRADVSSWDEVHAAVTQAHDGLGAIDLVCNVAGGAGLGMGMGPLLHIAEREWDRVQSADDVASAIAFLCSDDAGYITGEALNVSGGQTMV